MGEYLSPSKYNSYSFVSGHRDALHLEYTTQDVDWDPTTARDISEFLKAYKRNVSEKKANGEMSSQEGKDPMNNEGLEYLAKETLTCPTDMILNITAHLYLLLCWNLMARSITVSDLLIDHISWSGDALTIYVGKMKNDQENTRGYWRHVYANPLNPTICPVLALSLVIFSCGYRKEGTQRLFASNFQDNFNKWLTKFLKAKAQELLVLGLVVCLIGSHSFRKGVATLIASFPGGADSISIWLRAGWSLGTVAQRYIFASTGGDQFVGRCAVGLSILTEHFAILPPHFHMPSVTEVMTPERWEELVPNYKTMPPGFRSAMPYLLASFLKHREFLDQMLPSNHPVRYCKAWTSKFAVDLSEKVLGGVMENEVSHMQATGIPPNVVIDRRIGQLMENTSKLEAKIDTITGKVDSSSQFLIEQFRVCFDQLPQAVSESVLRNCQVEGAVPITPDQINELIATNFAQISELIEGLRNEMKTLSGNGLNPEEPPMQLEPSDTTGSVFDDGFASFMWGGRLHMVKEGFQLPSLSVMNWWTAYWEPNQVDNIRPLRFLKGCDLQNSTQKSYWCKSKYLLVDLTNIFKEKENLTEANIRDMTSINRDALFKKHFEGYILTKYCFGNEVKFKSFRLDAIVLNTLYDNVKKYNVKFNGEKVTKRRKLEN
mmetsp:Transcript_12129/g.15607  ORF Transcript_12129/g.15607 Transcript_12129/m.15607 type:complete len:659 (-) Transcript_12129:55-2031(-)